MMPADVDNAFDIAFWFADTALNENEYLQPQKLQRLMFIAQAYYTVAFNGRKLMPAMFVADEMGPIEPNIYTAFSKGRPDVDARMFLPHEVETFLDSIWRRFGHHSTDRLNKMVKETTAYKQAYKRSPRAEITLEAMQLSFARAEQTPGVTQVVKPK
ncbi:MAG: type II toxin-antitoxin system antitoxin SocA domain-containing protein, partial [Rhodospirillales bacterium]